MPIVEELETWVDFRMWVEVEKDELEETLGERNEVAEQRE